MTGETPAEQLSVKGIHSLINAGLNLKHHKINHRLVPCCLHKDWSNFKNVFLNQFDNKFHIKKKSKELSTCPPPPNVFLLLKIFLPYMEVVPKVSGYWDQ